MSINITIAGIPELEAELNRLNSIRWEAIRKKQVVEMLNRARAPGGTPVDTGEMRDSSGADLNDEVMGYTTSYAPHVEHGHRIRSGGYVEGQRFLKRNVDIQRPIYREDLIKGIRKEGG